MRSLPKGIIIIKWDNEIGAVLVAQYPKELKLPTKVFTNIYANHRIENTDPNFATITLKDSKVTSFFSGMGENIIVIPNHVIALVLRRDENPFKFKDVLKKSAAEILENIKNEKYKKLLPKLYDEMLQNS